MPASAPPASPAPADARLSPSSTIRRRHESWRRRIFVWARSFGWPRAVRASAGRPGHACRGGASRARARRRVLAAPPAIYPMAPHQAARRHQPIQHKIEPLKRDFTALGCRFLNKSGSFLICEKQGERLFHLSSRAEGSSLSSLPPSPGLSETGAMPCARLHRISWPSSRLLRSAASCSVQQSPEPGGRTAREARPPSPPPP